MAGIKQSQHLILSLAIGVSFIIIGVAIFLVLRGQATPLDVYTDPQYHFSLKYPRGWTVTSRPENGAALVSFVPPLTPGDVFAENVNITLFDLAREPRLTDIDAFTKETTRQLLGVFGKYVNVYDARKIRMGGLPAYRLAYVTHNKAEATQEKMKYLHAWTIKGQFAFILTFAGERQQFDESLKHVDRMIRTFRFEKE